MKNLEIEHILEPVDLPFRQIHLDFHTSGVVEGIAKNFDKDKFGDTLVKSHINSICCFALCHHGWLYYDSKKFPNYIHPHLENINLLKEQVEACHKRNIRCPVYITVMWNEQVVKDHPEWLKRSKDGDTINLGDPIGFHTELCVNTGYVDFLKAITKEVVELLGDELDGLFYDIVKKGPCYCENCKKEMLEKGVDFDDIKAVTRVNRDVISRFVCDMSEYVKTLKKDISVYYNYGCVEPGNRASLPAFTHLEFDSLPSGNAVGYKGMGARNRLDRIYGLQCVGQTGRFYTGWADFSTYKKPSTLKYECSKLLSYGARCLIGDQMFPDGTLDGPAYEAIGEAYEMVEKLEKWCTDVVPVAQMAVLTPYRGEAENYLHPATIMLERLAYQFDNIDDLCDFSKYKLLILPENITISEMLKVKLKEYIKNGGKVIATFESGLDAQKNDFAIEEFGVELDPNPITKDGELVRGEYFNRHNYADYILCKEKIGKNVINKPQCMYLKAAEVNLKNGEVLADIIEPIFYREPEHFYSHKQTPPSNMVVKNPAIVKNENCIYFAHPIFKIYKMFAPYWIEQIFDNCVRQFIEPVIVHDGPKFLRLTLNDRPKHNHLTMHILNYIMSDTAEKLNIVEDVFETNNLKITLNLEQNIKKIYTSDGEQIDFVKQDGKTIITVDKILGHKIVILEY